MDEEDNYEDEIIPPKRKRRLVKNYGPEDIEEEP